MKNKIPNIIACAAWVVYSNNSSIKKTRSAERIPREKYCAPIIIIIYVNTADGLGNGGLSRAIGATSARRVQGVHYSRDNPNAHVSTATRCRKSKIFFFSRHSRRRFGKRPQRGYARPASVGPNGITALIRQTVVASPHFAKRLTAARTFGGTAGQNNRDGHKKKKKKKERDTRCARAERLPMI